MDSLRVPHKSQSQRLQELLDAGDDMAAAITGFFAGNAERFTNIANARDDWNELRKQHGEAIDKIINR